MKTLKNKESLRNCHSQEESKETWQLNVIYPEWDSGTGKRTLGKNQKNPNKIHTSV